VPEEKKVLYQQRLSRYQTAMDLGKPDQVPVRLFLAEFVAKYAGYTNQEIYYDLEKNIEAVNILLTDFDLDVLVGPPSIWWASLHEATGARYLKFAGKELESSAQFQFIEQEYMLASDYDSFIENPTRWLVEIFFPRLFSELEEPGSYRAHLSLMRGALGMAVHDQVMHRAWEKWKADYSVPSAMAGMSKAPFDTLGDTLRGLHGIMLDLRQRPDQVIAATEVLVPHNIYYGLATAGGDREAPLFMPLHRGSFPFLNLRQWRTFYWPSLRQVIEGFWAAGKRVLFYAEGNWTPYLEFIAELPAKSIVFHVDMTDLDQALAVLGHKFCLSGNVPVGLLSYGTPQDVRAYCRDLLQKAAANGGFILDVAGSIQADAKTENVRALLEAARDFGRF